MTDGVDIVEVCPRDGFQAVPARIPTERKLAILRGLYAAGLRRIEATSFVSPDAYGLGAANSLAAWTAGVRAFDASVAGLGGRPFAPGATRNVATEDLVWMFESMGVATHIDLPRLLQVAETVEQLPQAQIGGRVREAVRAADRLRAQ